VGVGNNTGQCLAQARDENGFLRATDCSDAAPVTVHGVAVFQGFGQMDIFSLQNPDAPVLLGTFGTPNSFDLNRALTNPTRFLSANYLEVAGNLAFVSWELEGLRVVDFSNPLAPREVAMWSGEGRPPGAPPVHAWQVLRHRRSILLTSLSERKVYILKVVPGPGRLPAVGDRTR
jgi:hypothetical protein